MPGEGGTGAPATRSWKPEHRKAGDKKTPTKKPPLEGSRLRGESPVCLSKHTEPKRVIFMLKCIVTLQELHQNREICF